jgi:regulator of sigma E protease
MIITIILFLIVLAVLIFVHELGHFLIARACGIRVDEFALGFGPKLWKMKKGETTYALNLVPFGGYVKIFGENPDDESIGGPDSARSFVHKTKVQQIAVLAAGVFFNFLFAWIIIMALFMTGVPASHDDYPEYASRLDSPRITITYVEPGTPADAAHLTAGDIVQGFPTVEAVQNAVNASETKGIDLTYTHLGKEMTTHVVAKQGIVPDKYAIGISMDNVSTLRLPIHLAIYEGTRYTLHVIKTIAQGLWDLIVGMFKGKSALSSVSGPVAIAKYVGDAANLGLSYLLMFTALISINLGVLNLVPFPALDGGRILFVLIEALIRRPIKPKIANTVNAVGFALLLLLMVVVTYRDIAHMIVK